MTTRQKDANEFLEARYGKLTLGKVLYSIRKSEGWNQIEMAKKLGIPKSHLCDLEQDRKSIGPERAARFAKNLGYSSAQFVALSLQGLLNREGLQFTVSVKAA